MQSYLVKAFARCPRKTIRGPQGCRGLRLRNFGVDKMKNSIRRQNCLYFKFNNCMLAVIDIAKGVAIGAVNPIFLNPIKEMKVFLHNNDYKK